MDMQTLVSVLEDAGYVHDIELEKKYASSKAVSIDMIKQTVEKGMVYGKLFFLHKYNQLYKGMTQQVYTVILYDPDKEWPTHELWVVWINFLDDGKTITSINLADIIDGFTKEVHGPEELDQQIQKLEKYIED